MKMITALLPLIAISMCSAALASSPFDGTWTLNIERSHVPAATLSWEDSGNGRLRFTNLNFSYTFKPDGREFTTPVGLQQTVEKISDSLYRVVTKRNGSVLTTETWSLSSGGNTLIMESRGTQPNGQPSDIRQTYIRTSGGTGLVGKWKGTWKIRLPQNTLTIQAADKGGVILTLSANKWTIHGKWDGRAYPVRGPGLPGGFTATLSQSGTGPFKLVYKAAATVVEIDRFRLVNNGTSMVENGTSGRGQALFVDLWDKRP